MKTDSTNFIREDLPGARHFNRAASHRELAGRMRTLADILAARLDKKWSDGADRNSFSGMCRGDAYDAFNQAADPAQTRINNLRWEADTLSLKAAGHTAIGSVQRIFAKLGL